MAVLRDATTGRSTLDKNLQATAAALGVQLAVYEVRDPDEFEGTFAAMSVEEAGTAILNDSSLFHTNRARIAELAATSRRPARLPVL
jgi:hypothetical protein